MKEINEYIEKYCKKHEVDPEEARTHSTVRNAIQYYEHINDGKVVNIDGNIDDLEDRSC